MSFLASRQHRIAAGVTAAALAVGGGSGGPHGPGVGRHRLPLRRDQPGPDAGGQSGGRPP
jgi:hypothetical protein